MDIYASEEEQVEALKKWWNENGRSVVLGLVLGLGAVLGWKGWTQYQDTQRQQASNMFEQMMLAAANQDVETTQQVAQTLIGEQGASTYGLFGALMLARIEFEQGNTQAAEVHLRWVVDHAGDDGLREVARLRLARLLFNEGKLDEASGFVAEASQQQFAGEYAELRGDIALARGDAAEARKAYGEALAGNVGNEPLVQMKLDDLATGEAL